MIKYKNYIKNNIEVFAKMEETNYVQFQDNGYIITFIKDNWSVRIMKSQMIRVSEMLKIWEVRI